MEKAAANTAAFCLLELELKPGMRQLIDAEQEPPRGDGVVSLPKREGEAAQRLRGWAYTQVIATALDTRYDSSASGPPSEP